MSNQNKKERRRLKRLKRQRELRRAKSVSPFKLLSKSDGPVECWMPRDWKSFRQAGILCLRPIGMDYVFAGFLVDQGVAGLKDAWGQFNLSRAEFEEEILEPMDEQFDMIKVDSERAGKLVAGAIRWAHDNGFRLPQGYEKWLKVLGDIGDWRTADTRDFVLEFAGHPEDLRRRLIGCSMEEFLARKDIRIVLSDEAPILDDWDDDDESEAGEDGEDIDAFDDAPELLAEQLHETAARASDAIRKWCFQTGQKPSDRLEEGWELYLAATLAHLSKSRDGGKTSAALQDGFSAILSTLELEDRAELTQALKQITAFAQECPTPNQFIERLEG